MGFAPVEKVLPAAAWVSGLLHACLLRLDSDTLALHAFLAWRGQDAQELSSRADSLRQALVQSTLGLPQRVCATLFLVAENTSELKDADAALALVQEGHFLQKVLIASSSVCMDTGQVFFHGRIP